MEEKIQRKLFSLLKRFIDKKVSGTTFENSYHPLARFIRDNWGIVKPSEEEGIIISDLFGDCDVFCTDKSLFKKGFNLTEEELRERARIALKRLQKA
ncbi:hypothetical protein HZB01_03425 [Candidatus Woesearchaeota archaeon]|nr:hypothetical protein [Candidatus Woesearchaeota archaeon]